MFRTCILLIALSACRTTNSDVANESAREFIRSLPNTTAVTCAETDSDGDGYVTCTVFRGVGEPLPIECGSERFCIWNCKRGCKYVPIKVPRN